MRKFLLFILHMLVWCLVGFFCIEVIEEKDNAVMAGMGLAYLWAIVQRSIET